MLKSRIDAALDYSEYDYNIEDYLSLWLQSEIMIVPYLMYFISS